VAEVLVQFSEPVIGRDGTRYVARACGSEMPDGLWQGWIEFLDADGGRALRSGRETTQPNRADTVYWATGLTAVYLEGALERALKLPVRSPVEPASIPPPVFDSPAPDEFAPPAAPESILNPFSVYRHGETMLRNRLAALSPPHLVNIIRDHGLSDIPPDRLDRMTEPVLIELIVSAVRAEIDANAR
jgi:hypothetical protein